MIHTLFGILLLVAYPQKVMLNNSDLSVPVIKVVGAESTIDPGELVQLNADWDKTKLPTNLVEMKFQWIVIDNGKRKKVAVWPDGTQIVFAAGLQPRKIIVILDTNCLFEKKDDKGVIKEVDINSPDPIITEVQIGALPPIPTPPVPTPVPVPTPDPSLPDGKYKMAQFTYDIAIKDVAPTDRKAASTALYNSFNGVASRISAGALGGPENILSALKTSNQKALSSTSSVISAWAQFDKDWGDKMYDLYQRKLINTNNDWAQALKESAQGLDASSTK